MGSIAAVYAIITFKTIRKLEHEHTTITLTKANFLGSDVNTVFSLIEAPRAKAVVRGASIFPQMH